MLILIILAALFQYIKSDEYFLSYNSIRLNTTLDLSRFKLINSQIREQSYDFIHNQNTTEYTNVLFHSILQDCDVIDKKLNKISNGNKFKRSIINLGYFSEYLGIASVNSLTDIRKKYDVIEANFNKDKRCTQKKIDNLLSQTLILKRWIEMGKKTEINTSKMFFFYLKLNKIAQHLILTIQELEIAHLSNLLGNPLNLILDSNSIEEKIKKLTPRDAFTLPNLQKNITWEIINDKILQTISIPLIFHRDVCINKNNTLFCENQKSTTLPKNCFNFEINKLICLSRPCFTDINTTISCTPITENTFILESETPTPCELSTTTYKNHILINKKQVLFVESYMAFHCNNLDIPKYTQDTIEAQTHLLLNFSFNILNELKKSNLSQHPVFEDISKFVNLTKETEILSNDNSLIMDHTHMQIVNLTHTSFFAVFLILSIIIVCLFLKKKICQGEGNQDNTKNKKKIYPCAK